MVACDAICVTCLPEVCPVERKQEREDALAYCRAFGQHLRKIREEQGKGMRDFAAEADMEYSQYSKIERGVIVTSIYTVSKIAKALGIPAKDLFDFRFPVSQKK